MVIAKNTHALESLARQFREKTNLREYVALVDGVFDVDSLDFESYLIRDPRHRTRYKSVSKEDFEGLGESQRQGFRYAKSSFYKGRVYGNKVSLVLIRLSTGRTHQIRIHCRELKMPVLGDATYGRRIQLPADFSAQGRRALEGVPRQMLHAKKLGFAHPRTGEKLGFEVPLPSDFKSIVEVLEGKAHKE